MTMLATQLSAFLREHLPRERKASPHTCEAYAYTFQLLLRFAANRLSIRPSQLGLEQLDVPLVLAFLEHLEVQRGCSARTRNARLAAIHSFFRFLEYRMPSCLEQARQIGAIPMKRTDQALVRHLDRGTGATEGRDRERILPLSTRKPHAAISGVLGKAVARAANGGPRAVLERGRTGMTRSGFEYILAKHVAAAARIRPSIAGKRVTPHVLRHSCAMHTLQATGTSARSRSG